MFYFFKIKLEMKKRMNNLSFWAQLKYAFGTSISVSKCHPNPINYSYSTTHEDFVRDRRFANALHFVPY